MQNVLPRPVMYTNSGLRVNPLAPEQGDIRIEDIAHQLACTNRFCGAACEPISVAQHCVYAAWLLSSPPSLSLAALLHDAAEAYLGDVTKWLKASPEMRAFREAEDRVQATIHKALGIPDLTEGEVELVDYVDRLLVRYEGAKGFGDFWHVTGGQGSPDDSKHHSRYPPLTKDEVARVDALFGGWSFWPWRMAKDAFLNTYHELKEKVDAPSVP